MKPNIPLEAGVCVYIPTWINFKLLLKRLHLCSLYSAESKQFFLQAPPAACWPFFCVLAWGWLTAVCLASSLTQQGRDWTVIDRCLVHSLSTSGPDSDWQMACRAEGPPPAGVSLCVFILQRTEQSRSCLFLSFASFYLSIPGKVRWLWIWSHFTLDTLCLHSHLGFVS